MSGRLRLRDIWKVQRAQFSVLVAIAAVAFLGLKNAAADEPKRVLLVHSFGSAAPPFTVESAAFEAELVAKMGDRVDLDEVSLDMARYPDRDMQEAIVDYLQKRQAKWQPDLVVPIGSPAAIFVANVSRPAVSGNAYPLRLSRSPITAAGRVGQERRLRRTGYIDIPGFLEDMLQVAPATKNIAVIVGATPLERLLAGACFKRQPSRSQAGLTSPTSAISPSTKCRSGSRRCRQIPTFFLLLLRDAARCNRQCRRGAATAPCRGARSNQFHLRSSTRLRDRWWAPLPERARRKGSCAGRDSHFAW